MKRARKWKRLPKGKTVSWKVNNGSSIKENRDYCKFQGSELGNETRLLKGNTVSLKNYKNEGSNKRKMQYCKLLESELRIASRLQ